MSKKKPNYVKVFKKHNQPKSRADYASEAYDEALEYLKDGGLVTKARLNTLDRYVRARTEYEFLYASAMSGGPALKKRGGGSYANMEWSAVGKLNEQIMKFEESLLISPRAAQDKVASKEAKQKPSAADEFFK